MPKRYRNDIMRSVHRAMAAIEAAGGIDKTTMREFDGMCLTKIEALSPKEIKAIRSAAGVSQAVFAAHLGITTGLVSKWECGHKLPSRMALKLLALVKTKGLEAVA